MHCDYGTEFFWKEKQLKDFLLRSGVAEAGAFTAGVPSPQREFYRNKLTLHRGEGKSGYCGFDNRTVIPVEQCRLADRRINELLPLEGDVLLRCTAVDGAKVIGPGTAGILHEEISGFGKFAVAGNGFFQVNIPVAAELVKRVLAVMKSSGVRELLELYCGIGLFSIVLAENMPELHCCGIELNKEAVKFARINAKEHHVGDRCRFFAGDAGKGLRKMGKHSGEFAVLLDPPRTGVEKETVKMIGSSGAAQIIYISCAADTLTRDLKELTAAGYKVESFQALDMFPCTAHFETLSLLSFHGKRK